MEKILKKKSKHEHLKVILVIGSYDTKSYGFNSVTNPNNTKVFRPNLIKNQFNFFIFKAIEVFSKNLINFLRKFNFDGVLLDYEFPNMLNRGSPPHTKQGFSLLVKVKIQNFKKLNKNFFQR